MKVLNRVRNSTAANLFRGIIHCLFLSFLCSSVFFSASAGTIDWRNDYTISLTMERDDNFRLTEVDPIDTTSTNFRASGELRGATEVSNFQIGLVGSTTNYSESSIEDSELYNLFFQSDRRGERWLGTLNLSLTVEPTTQSELLDTGDRIDGERESVSIMPGINYELNEKNSIYVNLSFLDVNYDTVSLTEYTDNSIAMGWVRKTSETSNISINGTVSEYDPETEESTTITSLGIGYGFGRSETTRYNLSLGYAEADTPVGSNRDGNSSFQIQHTFDERNSFSLFVSNGFVGSGSGEVRHQSRLNLSWNHALAERLQLVVAAEGLKNDLRDYAEILVGGSYRYNRELIIEANYRYRNQQTDTVDADSNSVLLSLRYSPVSDFRHTL